MLLFIYYVAKFISYYKYDMNLAMYTDVYNLAIYNMYTDSVITLENLE